MASGVHVMEKPIQLQQQQQQQQQQQPHEALKCPRCDSSNTKFCYYNNYSLSQPRHFCKACKRYWTRGGTLRNVPVGGGCRKNKRIKRPINNTVHAAATTPPVNRQTNPNPNTNLDQNSIPSSTTSNSTTNHNLNHLLYGMFPTRNPSFPGFDTRVSSLNEVSGYDLIQPHHINASGLGFSSTGTRGSLVGNHCHNSNLAFSSYNNSSMYCGGSTTSSTSAPTTMASLLASSLDQQQRFMGFATYDGGSTVKDPKMEETQNRMDWSTNNFLDQNTKNDQTDHHQHHPVVSCDPNSLLWDSEGGCWLDPMNNIGSSVSSLI
ncbi:hypothetical protein QVD17_17969 [Tagetes erecta]|uniref:Dof zinc finger protein n=1 Tax=Tagetes erecta TaxID=13708 RepID=A0AAD8KH40_TARER|nr:hypothetical protein QVD17_17969 [Tagetes erecta]